MQHQDLVHVLDGGQPVRDHDRGAALQEHGQRPLDERLGLGVDGRGRLVEDQHPRVVGEGAREGQELLLPDRQRGAPLLDLAVVALGQGLDEAVRVHGARGGAHPLVRDRRAEADVGGDGPAEQVDVLEDERQRRAQPGGVEVPHVHAVQGHAALLHVVEAGEQADDRGLARSGGPHEGHAASRRHHEVDVLQHPGRLVSILGRRVREGHALEGHASLHLQQRHRARRAPAPRAGCRAGRRCAPRTPWPAA